MRFVQIKTLVAKGESERLELKKSTGELRAGCQTLCAFLNGTGGKVIFGATESGRIPGQDVTDMTQREIAEALKRIEPAAKIGMSIVPMPQSSKRLIVLEARPIATHQPYLYDGRAYMRVGSTTTAMPRERLLQALNDGAHPDGHWEKQSARGYSINDLSRSLVRDIVRRGMAAKRIRSIASEKIPDILRKFGLLNGGKPNNAAVVLFAKEVSGDYPQCRLHMARFQGIDKREIIDEYPPTTGNAFDLLDEAMIFLRKHIPVSMRVISGQLQHVEEPLLPMDALREAVTNALCHREYSEYNTDVTVQIYDNRVEVWNPGRLPERLSISKLKRPHESIPRNPLIAKVFYLGGFIEAWGRGTLDIVRYCVEAGHPEPEFEEDHGTFIVRFIPRTPLGRTASSKDLRAGLTERQRRILALLEPAPLSPPEIIGLLEPRISLRTLEREIRALRGRGLVQRQGPDHAVVWSLVKNIGA